MKTQKIEIKHITVGKRIRKDLGDISSLKESINNLGLLQPIIINKQFQIVAGERRLEACKELGWIDIPVLFKNNMEDQIEIDENTKRKDFTPSECYEIWQNLKPMCDSHTDDKRKLASEITGVGQQKLSRIKQIVEYGNEEMIIEMNKQNSVNNIYNEIKKLKRKEGIEIIRNSEITTPDGLFDVIVVDPPWDYKEKLGDLEYDSNKARGWVEYSTMTLNEIKQINIPSTKNSVLFLWTTQRFLPDSFEVLKEWGFEYRTTIVWDKINMGLGRTIRLQCEFCLIGIKGNPMITGESERDIISEKRREHSRKPDKFYNKVERMCIGRKLDYFSREKREGWEQYGNEINKN